MRNPGETVVITDEKGQVRFCRSPTADFFQVAEQPIIGASVLDLVRGLTRPMLDGLYQNLQNEKLALIETTCTRKDGADCSVRVTVTPRRSRSGQVIGMVFVFSDITSQKDDEETARQAERHLAMIASVGAACHHLGQPATVLTTNLELIRRMTADLNRPDLANLLEQCRAATEKIAEILRKLNRVTEFRTVHYLEQQARDSERNIILDI